MNLSLNFSTVLLLWQLMFNFVSNSIFGVQKIQMKDNLLLTIIAIFLLNGCTVTNSEPMVIGHRGAMGHETENTLASIQKAMDFGVDMIEIDVFKIKSGEIVVFHDEQVDRLSDGTGRIENYNMESVKELTLIGSHEIPLLEDVLRLMDNKIALNIELKGANTAEEVNHIVNAFIKDGGWHLENFIISSFKWDELRKMREVNAHIKIAVLTEEDPLGAIATAKELNAVAINPDYKTLTSENIGKIKEAGLKIYTWTVNELDDIKKMKDYGVDGIITNYPERVR